MCLKVIYIHINKQKHIYLWKRIFSVPRDHDRILQYFIGLSTITRKALFCFTLQELGPWMVRREYTRYCRINRLPNFHIWYHKSFTCSIYIWFVPFKGLPKESMELWSLTMSYRLKSCDPYIIWCSFSRIPCRLGPMSIATIWILTHSIPTHVDLFRKYLHLPLRQCDTNNTFLKNLL